MDKSALSRATEPSAAPTPGYLYNDIGKTLVTPQACQESLQFLIHKLTSKSNPHVKRKCLKVLTKAAAAPSSRGRMKRIIVQDPKAVSAIKEMTQWRGTMDAITGDQWNVELREAAKECLEVIYSDDHLVDVVGGGQLAGAGMTGLAEGANYGTAMGGLTGTAVSNAPSRMEGIGNPMYKDPRLTSSAPSISDMTITEVAANVGTAVLEMIKDPLARKVEAAGNTLQRVAAGYDGPTVRPDPYAQPPPGRSNLSMQTAGQWTMASNRGPNAIGSSSNNAAPPTTVSNQNSEYYKVANAVGTAFRWAGVGSKPLESTDHTTANSTSTIGGVGGSWASAVPIAPTIAARSRAEANGTALSGPTYGSSSAIYSGNVVDNAISNGTYEKNLIAELCPPGGMKAEPPPDKLEEFTRVIPSLNPDWICPALLDALEEGNPWIMRAKALCVIETVLTVMAKQSSAEGGSNTYADFFHACSEEIRPLVNHARVAIKEPAKRVLIALGLEVNGDRIVVNGGVVAPSSTVVSTSVVEAPNLLDFDDVASPLAAPVTSSPVEVLTATPVPTNIGGQSDLFCGLSTKETILPNGINTTVPTSSTPTESNDLLGNFDEITSSADAKSTHVVSSNNLFGDMNIKGNEIRDSTSSQPLSLPSTTSGSAFGFMNSTAPTSLPSEDPKTPLPQSFDPLLNLSAPNISPSFGNNNSNNPHLVAQMQALAYQQQMLMMQQQMQKMQMVYGGSSGGAFLHPGASSGMGGVAPVVHARPNVMGANYMRQVPGVQGDKMSSFSFLGSDPKKEDNHSFDFVKDAMKKG